MKNRKSRRTIAESLIAAFVLLLIAVMANSASSIAFWVMIFGAIIVAIIAIILLFDVFD